MNDIPLNIRRPRIKNAFWCVGFLLLCAAFAILFVFVLGLPTETTAQKVISCVLFGVSWLGMLFSATAAANCLRNIFSAPSVTLTNEKLTVVRGGELEVREIDCEKTVVKKNKVIFTDINGNTVQIKQASVSIPVGTIAYAVKQRTKIYEK